MIKFLILTLITCLSAISFAAEKTLQIPADLSFVTAQDGPYDAKHGNAIRYRMSVKNSLGGEGPQVLLFEKFAPGKDGMSDKVIFSKEMAATDLPKVKEFTDNLAKKSVEATYGCCGVEKAIWKDYKISFVVRRENKVFSCSTTEFADEKFKVTCKE